MSALAPSRYRVWRVADLKGKPRSEKMGPTYPWERGVCSDCSEPVWFRADHAEGLTLVCWRCPE